MQKAVWRGSKGFCRTCMNDWPAVTETPLGMQIRFFSLIRSKMEGSEDVGDSATVWGGISTTPCPFLLFPLLLSSPPNHFSPLSSHQLHRFQAGSGSRHCHCQPELLSTYQNLRFAHVSGPCCLTDCRLSLPRLFPVPVYKNSFLSDFLSDSAYINLRRPSTPKVTQLAIPYCEGNSQALRLHPFSNHLVSLSQSSLSINCQDD